MMLFTNIVLSTSISLILTTATAGLDRTYQIRHPYDDVTNERHLSSWTALTGFLERLRCRKRLRECRRVTSSKRIPLDEWEARLSILSGGNSTTLLVQALQDAIVKAQSVDMEALTNALKTPTAGASDKKALLKEVRTIKAEAQAIRKAASTSGVEDAAILIEKMQTVLGATSILTQKVFGQQFGKLFDAVKALVKAYISCAATVCCGEDPPVGFPGECNVVCVVFASLPFTPFLVLFSPLIILWALVALTFVIFYNILWECADGPGRAGRNDDTCSDNLLSCQYESLLFAIMPTSIALVEELG